jgi:hypothetical protein
MSAQLDFPPIIEQAARTDVAVADPKTLDLAKVDLTTVALAQFGNWRNDVDAAKAKLTGLVLDLSTQAKVDEAKSLRQRTVNQPVAEVRKVSKALKSKLASVSKAIGAEEEAAVEAWGTVGELLTPQIDARQKVLDDEKAERQRIANEKAEAHRAKIAKIRAAADNAKGISSERITNGIALVESLTFGEECENFLGEYEKAKAETLMLMRAHLIDSQAREEAEARRLENERIAAELAAQRKVLEDQAAELKRQTEAAHAARVAITHAAVFAFPEPEPVKITEAQPPQQVLKAEPEMAEATDRGVAAIASPSVGSMGAGQASDEAPAGVAQDAPTSSLVEDLQDLHDAAMACHDAAVKEIEAAAEPTLITTAQLGEALGLPVQAALIESLGFTAIKLKKPGAYWDQAKVKEIGEALIAYVAKNIEAI